MVERTFTHGDQLAFAKISADYNPFHVDPHLARRLPGGSAAVHGIHTILWGIEKTLPEGSGLFIESINIEFISLIHVGSLVSIQQDKSSDPLLINFSLLVEGAKKTVVQMRYGRGKERHSFDFAPIPDSYSCCEIAPKDIEGARGDISLFIDRVESVKLFPCLQAKLPLSQLALLLAISRLVGMECPGLHSILSTVELNFSPKYWADISEYVVSKFDKRFRLIELDVATPVGSGTIQAFMRPEPQKQLSASQAFSLVSPCRFQGQRALVVGGSRGLGEATAKLLAAGGASVWITYCRGKVEAENVVARILQAGGQAASLGLDVQSLSSVLNEYAEMGITHLYYFASPYIASGQRGQFSERLFNRFCDYYVVGFVNSFCAMNTGSLEYVFQPSTIFVNEPQPHMGEYVAAKSAMEMMCRHLSAIHREIIFDCPRLPRLATDQTSSLYPIKNGDPAVEMLKHLPETL